MTKNIIIDERLENYISDNTYSLHPIQKEIIEYNKTLGDLKRMQVSVTQAYFFQLMIKLNNIKKILEIGTFTGYSALSMGLSLPIDGTVNAAQLFADMLYQICIDCSSCNFYCVTKRDTVRATVTLNHRAA